MRISDWSSDVCSSDLVNLRLGERDSQLAQHVLNLLKARQGRLSSIQCSLKRGAVMRSGDRQVKKALVRFHCGVELDGQQWLCPLGQLARLRSEEPTSELQSLMRISYSVFCLKKKKDNTHTQ